MNPSNPAKVGIAFAAGIAVALASAVIYVRSTGASGQPTAATPAVQQATQPDNLNGGRPEEAPKPVASAAPVPVPVPEPAKPNVAPAAPPAPARATTTHATRRHYPHHTPSTESTSSIRVEVSQLHAPEEAAQATAPVTALPPPVQSPAPAPYAPAPAPMPAPPPPPQPHTVTLPAGTNLIIRLGETISTEHNYSGDTFRATLDRPVIVDGFVIADKGSKVLGKIVTAEKAGKLEGTANLQLVVTEINTTDGQRVRVETGFVNRKGPSNTRQEAAKIGGGAVLGAIIGAIAGGGKGAAIGAGAGGAAGTGAVLLGKTKPAVIQNETQLTFQLSSPATITEKLN